MEHDSYILLATANREDLEQHPGYCVACLGEVTDVKGWIDDEEGKTAICPHCAIDAVVPSNRILDEGKAWRRLQILRHWRRQGFGSLDHNNNRGQQHQWLFRVSAQRGCSSGSGEG